MPLPLNPGVPDAGLAMADFRFETVEPEFDQLTLSNAPVEVLATGFRWIEGLVWMGDWATFLFQDLPRGRTRSHRVTPGGRRGTGNRSEVDPDGHRFRFQRTRSPLRYIIR
ncbi:hypothetical protein [Aureimonas jatrophae]|uniref:SMP-30/Gluconolaconase/LRE-like region-containing protein n=1 Tax=Aureimonas jatrophae TaxID=1166073 RepID=A0A1H0JB90_9HYPH|nr:hypothetical protein [Aureimonas jatrophae]MBB3951505.1 sugar lactone lactonase YvrE [Aureimonas jatrophae]SDO40759.1 hypothetical protein SAMN05192530_10690 [Aureimonas jatrophae]